MSLLRTSALAPLFKQLYHDPKWIASLSGQERAIMKQQLLLGLMESERLDAPMSVYSAYLNGLLGLETSTGTSSTASCGLTTSKPERFTLTRTLEKTVSLRTRVRRSLSAMLSPLRYLLVMPALFMSPLLTGLAYLLSTGTRSRPDFGRLSPPTNLLTSGESWNCSTGKRLSHEELSQAMTDPRYTLRLETIADSAQASLIASLRNQTPSQ